jgi:hypothetical protein
MSRGRPKKKPKTPPVKIPPPKRGEYTKAIAQHMKRLNNPRKR